jgi:hypothetical protein
VAIRLETSKKRGVDNHQDSEITEVHRRWFPRLSKLHPNAIARSQPSPLFNCHGLTFASRRTKIFDRRDILKILEDDAWHEIDMRDVLGGDVVIYFDDEGDPNHSGIIVEGAGDAFPSFRVFSLPNLGNWSSAPNLVTRWRPILLHFPFNDRLSPYKKGSLNYPSEPFLRREAVHNFPRVRVRASLTSTSNWKSEMCLRRWC